MHQDILGAVQLQSIFAEKDLRDSGHRVEGDQQLLELQYADCCQQIE